MKRLVLTLPESDAEFAGDMLANALRAVATSVDEPTQWFDDPAHENGLQQAGIVRGGDVSSTFNKDDVVATWTLETGLPDE